MVGLAQLAELSDRRSLIADYKGCFCIKFRKQCIIRQEGKRFVFAQVRSVGAAHTVATAACYVFSPYASVGLFCDIKGNMANKVLFDI